MEFGEKVLESEAWNLRTGAGKRGLEFRAANDRVPEIETWSLE